MYMYISMYQKNHTELRTGLSKTCLSNFYSLLPYFQNPKESWKKLAGIYRSKAKAFGNKRMWLAQVLGEMPSRRICGFGLFCTNGKRREIEGGDRLWSRSRRRLKEYTQNEKVRFWQIFYFSNSSILRSVQMVKTPLQREIEAVGGDRSCCRSLRRVNTGEMKN